jgi:hypothetical protein
MKKKKRRLNMSYEFKGSINNDFSPENGTNISVKGLEEDRVILQATKSHEFEKKQDSDKLTFTISPSSGGTGDSCSLKVEVTEGTENTKKTENEWEVEITCSSDSKPAEVNISFVMVRD